VLLGLLDGSAVSYAIFFPHFGSYRGRPWLYLEDLYVQPDAAGHGVGRSMMAHLARVTVQRGWAGIAWGVLDWNEPGIYVLPRARRHQLQRPCVDGPHGRRVITPCGAGGLKAR
jgi:GNAT superfamily N-acetyltransferase